MMICEAFRLRWKIKKDVFWIFSSVAIARYSSSSFHHFSLTDLFCFQSAKARRHWAFIMAIFPFSTHLLCSFLRSSPFASFKIASTYSFLLDLQNSFGKINQRLFPNRMNEYSMMLWKRIKFASISIFFHNKIFCLVSAKKRAMSVEWRGKLMEMRELGTWWKQYFETIIIHKLSATKRD